MATKKELIQFVLTNATNCDFNIPMFENNVPSINATTKYSWDITSESLACGFGSIIINGIVYNFTFDGTLSGLLSVLNATSSSVGCGFFCFEIVVGNTFVYVVDDNCVFGDLSLCGTITTTTTTTTSTTTSTTTAPSTSTTTSTTTAPSTTSTTTSTTTAPSTSTTTSTTTGVLTTSTTSTTTTAASTSTTTSTTTAPSTSTTTSTTTAPSTSTTTSTTTAPSTTSTTTSTTTLPIGVFSGDVWFGTAPSTGFNNACDNASPNVFLYWGGVSQPFTVGTQLFTDSALTIPYTNPSGYTYCRSDASGGGFPEYNLSGNTLGTATGTIC